MGPHPRPSWTVCGPGAGRTCLNAGQPLPPLPRELVVLPDSEHPAGPQNASQRETQQGAGGAPRGPRVSSAVVKADSTEPQGAPCVVSRQRDAGPRGPDWGPETSWDWGARVPSATPGGQEAGHPPGCLSGRVQQATVGGLCGATGPSRSEAERPVPGEVRAPQSAQGSRGAATLWGRGPLGLCPLNR